ncbi:MAG: ribose-phosphate diphosphokinase, partial [Planctomycetota bacterium]
GAKDIVVAATHAVLVGLAMERIADSPINRVVVTDTIPCTNRCDAIADKLTELTVAELLGQAVHNIHHNLSVSNLFRKGIDAAKR